MINTRKNDHNHPQIIRRDIDRTIGYHFDIPITTLSQIFVSQYDLLTIM